MCKLTDIYPCAWCGKDCDMSISADRTRSLCYRNNGDIDWVYDVVESLPFCTPGCRWIYCQGP